MFMTSVTSSVMTSVMSSSILVSKICVTRPYLVAGAGEVGANKIKMQMKLIIKNKRSLHWTFYKVPDKHGHVYPVGLYIKKLFL